jgi:deoxyribodipyrimidine photo-lyase
VSDGRTTVVWFRRDLRVADNPALREAVDAGRVVCLFVVDPALLARRHHAAPARRRFLRAGLEALDGELRSRGSRLVVRSGRPEEVVPAVAAEAGADAVHFAREVSPLARARDERVTRALEAARVRSRALPGDLLAEPEDLPGSSGAGYLVFTPFHRAWRSMPIPPHLPAPRRIRGPELASEGLDRLPSGEPPLPAGPAAARARIVEFVGDGGADAYPGRRDLLAEDGTSRLSAYLRLGMCTPAQIGRALGLPGVLSPGREGFWRQVCWREFYHHHLARHPEVLRAALAPALRAVRWDDDPADLAAWTAGETGYPLVDAGMRQLARDAWIPNRARMVVASFLVKDMLVDWRRGETAFMRGLVDGDPASNNGGWQWTAGTGTDAAPYFRILSPIRQARRFDPDGAYARRHLPELRDVPDERIHEPWTMTPEEQRAAGCRIGVDYPAPRVDHAARREIALARYREARADSASVERTRGAATGG